MSYQLCGPLGAACDSEVEAANAMNTDSELFQRDIPEHEITTDFQETSEFFCIALHAERGGAVFETTD